jgi:hypothetical protein
MVRQNIVTGDATSYLFGQPRPHSSADDPGDRIADSAQIILLQHRAGDVSAHSTSEQLNALGRDA